MACRAMLLYVKRFNFAIFTHNVMAVGKSSKMALFSGTFELGLIILIPHCTEFPVAIEGQVPGLASRTNPRNSI